MSHPCQGRIVWVEVPDLQGRNPKKRPAVIISADKDIRPDGEVEIVCITTEIGRSPPEECVALPWHRAGHPRTKLKEESEAVCTWNLMIPVSAIREFGGLIPLPIYLSILQKCKAIKSKQNPGTPP